MKRLLHYLFAAFFLISSMQVSARICSDMEMDSHSKIMQQDDMMKNCHSDKKNQPVKVNDDANHQDCCDDHCLSYSKVSVTKTSNDFTLISRFSNAIKDKSLDIISTYYKIITPPPIV